MGNRRDSRSWSLAVVLTLALAAWLAPAHLGRLHAAQAPAGDVQALLAQGFYSYEEGALDPAVAAFERAFALNPTNDALLTFVEKVTVAKVYDMLRSKDPRVSGVARQILESSSAVVVAKVHDPKQIQDAIRDALASEDQARLVQVIRATATFGRNLVPYLVPYLADTDISKRTTVLNWVARIGLDAVPVLQAARKHPNPVIRRNVADLLGTRTLRHPVSLATLKAMVETDASAEVKDTAKKAFQAILSDLDTGGQELSAKEYFLANAYEQYYLDPYKNPFASTYYLPTVYALAGEEVRGERVADFQLSARMAQQALEEALELDPAFDQARMICLCNDAAQIVEYDLNVTYYAKNEGRADQKEILAKQQPYVDQILRNRLFAPENVLFSGLMQALEDGKSDVARKVLETMSESYRGGAVPESLLRAIEDTNSRLVRTAAAVVLAYWNPQTGFDSGEQVVTVLADATFTSGIRTVQKVMGNVSQANRLDEIFRELNMESYSPFETLEAGFDAIVKAPPDVVFIDESIGLSDDVRDNVGRRGIVPVNHLINELRKNYRSANVPVIVVVAGAKLEASKKLYQSEERKVWVVSDSVDRLALDRTIFSKIFKDKDDAKTLATRLAKQAAEALNYLASTPSARFPTAASIPVLRKVLVNRPDEVRVPSIMTLGNLKATAALGELATVFSRSENAHAVRLESMRAMGKILGAMPDGAPAPVLKIVLAGMEESDLALRRASWYAFSNAKADPAVQYKALVAKPGQAPAESKAEAPAEKVPGAEAPADAAVEAPADTAVDTTEPEPEVEVEAEEP